MIWKLALLVLALLGLLTLPSYGQDTITLPRPHVFHAADYALAGGAFVESERLQSAKRVNGYTSAHYSFGMVAADYALAAGVFVARALARHPQYAGTAISQSWCVSGP
jgi:hypothetical protein